jgi:hypothetical protein
MKRGLIGSAEAAGTTPVLKRLVWLIVCLGAGGLIGAAGSALTGNNAWYLAIPVAVAAGWMFFANPVKCDPALNERKSPTDGSAN